MLIFYDTETTGLPLWSSPSEDDGQPHLVQIAALLTEDDGQPRATFSAVIKPDGWTIPDEVAAIHGITTELAQRVGISLACAMAALESMMSNADLRIAHNNSFDDKMAKISGHRAGLLGIRSMIEAQPVFCTMKSSTNICRILKDNPRTDSDWKWPKLGEAYKHFFQEELTGAHDALVDVKACRRIYFELQRQKQEAA